MAFPATPLGLMVELALGADLSTTDLTSWTWTDITRYVRYADGITITRGRADEFSVAAPSKAKLTLINDGRFVVRNPVGAYYGTISRNTPLRVLVRPDTNTASDAFGRTTSNGWGTADVGGAWTVNGTASEYSTTGSVARVTHGSANVRRYGTLAASLTTLDETVRIRTGALATGGYLSGGIMFRYVDSSNFNRAELLFNTDQTITVRLVTRVAGVDTVAATATTALTHVANTFVRLRVQSVSATGRTVRAKAWADTATPPDTWDVQSVLSVNTAAGPSGLTSIRQTGNTNSNAIIEFDDFTLTDGWYKRHTGFVDEWPTRWNDAGLRQMLAPVTASGMTRRLQQGRAVGSAIRRGVLTQAATPRAYWPMEDGSSATQIASGIVGGLPMRVSPPITLGAGQAAGSDPLVQLSNTGRVWGDVQPYTGTDWTVMFLINIPAATASGQGIFRFQTSGSYPTWQLVLTPGAGVDQLTLQAYDSGLTERLADAGIAFLNEPYGRQLWVEIAAQQVGADIGWSYEIFGVAPNTSIAQTGTKASATAGTVTAVSCGNGSGADQLVGTTLGHASVWDTTAVSLGFLACVGWSEETSHSRWVRIGRQENIAMTQTANPAYDMATMGAPTSGTLLSQIREIEVADQAVVYDDTDGQIVILHREQRFAQTVGLTLDVSQRQVAWPLYVEDDDQQLRNDVTSSSPHGSSYQHVDTTSPLAVGEVGYYATTRSVNLAYDNDLRFDAEFAVALGTVDEVRYPQVPIDLTRSPALIPAWLATNIGNRLQITHQPNLLTPDTIDLIVEGYTERLDHKQWTATLNTSSGRPWRGWIAETGAGNSSRVDSGTSTTAAQYTSSATSLSITTTAAGDLWGTSGSFPFDVVISGERITVTAISGSSSPQTFTVTRGVNGIAKTLPAGSPVHLYFPSVLAL